MRGSIRKRGSSWLLTVELPHDPQTGARRRQHETCRGSERKARARLAELLAEVGHAPPEYAPSLTLAAYLDRWLRYQETRITARTMEDYRRIAARISATLGSALLVRLRPLALQEHYTTLLESGMSPASIRTHHRVISAALRQAERWELITRSPASLVRPPRVVVPEREPLGAAELARLLGLIADHPDYPAIITMAATGLRPGEFLALHWDDVDMEGGTLHVKHAIEQADNLLRLKDPKTAAGRRVVHIPALVVAVLIRHKARQAEHRLRLGPTYEDSDYVFGDVWGALQSPDAFGARWRRLRGRLGFPNLRLYDLRHGFASLLLQAGHSAPAVASLMGHADKGAVLLRHYAHSLGGDSARAAETMERILQRGQE